MSQFSRLLSGYGKAHLVFVGSLFAIVLFVLAGQGAGTAHAQGAVLNLTPITWSVLGLDASDPNQGPNEYPVGVRVCNTGTATTTQGISSTFTFTSSNTLINLANASATQTFPQLAANSCRDIYYTVRVNRTSAAFDPSPARRTYTIAVSDGSNTASTGQELIVQGLPKSSEQQRLSTVTIDGPTTVAPNTTASITVEGTAGVTGYPELQHFLTLCPDLLRLDSVDTEYDVPPSEATSELWADGCIWDTQHNSGCTTTGDKYGSNFFYSVNVTVLGTGTCNVRSMIYAFDGTNYAYNSDFGTDLLSITAGGTGGAQQPTATPGGPTATATGPTATLPPGVTPSATQPISGIPTRTPTPARGTSTAPTATLAPGATAAATSQPGELPQTGYRARPGMLFFADLNSPDLNSSQTMFTWLVIATLAVGVVLAIWSLLVFTGVFSRESDFAYGIWKGLTVLFVLAALSLMGLMGYNLLAAQPGAPVVQPQPRRSIEVYTPPEIPATHLVIPTLDIDTELTEAPVLGDTWDVSVFFDEIAHLEGTAYVGTSGNAVLAGHVNTVRGVGPFWNLKSLQPGHMIIARGPGIEYRYQVEWVKTVEPDDVSVLEPSDDPILTLVSCTDWNSASWSYEDRLVVRAKFFDRLRSNSISGQ